MENKIYSKDISVILQGPVYGKTDYSEHCTKEVCESVRKWLPDAEIILSTWNGSDTSELDYDICVLSEDPGTFMVDYGEEYNGSTLTSMNINRQIVSSVNGLKKAKRKYAVKMRTDTVLTGNNFLNYFYKYNNKPSENYIDVLKHRVITLCSMNARLHCKQPFYLCDFFFFGYTEDVLNIWDVELVDEKKLKLRPGTNNIGYYENYGAEQFFWLAFLRKYQNVPCDNCLDTSNHAIERSEEAFASYCIFLTAKTVGINSLKVGRATYMTEPYVIGMYTMNDWKKMYNKYCGGKEKISGVWKDKLKFFVVYYNRYYCKKYFKNLYKVLKKVARNFMR